MLAAQAEVDFIGWCSHAYQYIPMAKAMSSYAIDIIKENYQARGGEPGGPHEAVKASSDYLVARRIARAKSLEGIALASAEVALYEAIGVQVYLHDVVCVLAIAA